MPLHSLQMMHLADSALPVGGFAFSSGLEAAAQSGILQTRTQLQRYFRSTIRQWGSFDRPFLVQFNDPGTAEGLQRYDRMMLASAMRSASTAQARGWLRILPTLFPSLDSPALRNRFAQASCPLHALPLITFALKDAGASLFQIEELCLFTFLRDQMNAAVRLGLLGPAAAQVLQTELEHDAQALLAEAAPEEPVRTTPLLDVAQMLPDALRTKLFRN